MKLILPQFNYLFAANNNGILASFYDWLASDFSLACGEGFTCEEVNVDGLICWGLTLASLGNISNSFTVLAIGDSAICSVFSIFNCQTLISSGYDILSFTYDVLIITDRITVFGTSYSAKSGITLGFDQENKKIQGKGGKRVILWTFLDPSSPRLASDSPRS